MMQENHFGRTSVLSLETIYKKNKTIIKDCYFTPPFKLTRPFYLSGDEMKLIVMSASAGMMAGDCQEISLKIGQNSQVYYTTQSYEKIHKMEQGEANRRINITIDEHAFLKYMPLSVIPFEDSVIKNYINIELKDNTSKLLFCDLITAGRVGHGECFKYKYYGCNVNITQKGKLLYHENTVYEPKVCDMQGFGMYEGYTHLVNVLLINIGREKELLEQIRELIAQTPDINGGASLMQCGGISIKALGRSAQRLEDLVGAIKL